MTRKSLTAKRSWFTRQPCTVSSLALALCPVQVPYVLAAGPLLPAATRKYECKNARRPRNQAMCLLLATVTAASTPGDHVAFPTMLHDCHDHNGHLRKVYGTSHVLRSPRRHASA